MTMNGYIVEFPFFQSDRDFWGGVIEDYLIDLLNASGDGSRNWLKASEVLGYIEDRLKGEELTKDEVDKLEEIVTRLKIKIHEKNLHLYQVVFLWRNF